MTSNSPNISLITTTYNRVNLLPRLVRSIEAQSDVSFEWIIVDDGSTDGSGQFIRTLEDPRIKLIEQGNLGCNAARNRAEQVITGNYVVFIDSDDELADSTTLARMHSRIKNTPEDIGVVAFAVTTPEGGGGASKMDCDELIMDYRDQLCGNRIEGEFFRIYKREALALASWESDFLGMEILKYLAIAKKFRTLFVRDVALIYHMNHGDNLTSSRQTILRAPSMIEGYEKLLLVHGNDLRIACPRTLGLNHFHTAMYCAIDGQNRRAMKHIAHSLRAQGPLANNLMLVASLLLPLSVRRKLFIWRSTMKGRW